MAGTLGLALVVVLATCAQENAILVSATVAAPDLAAMFGVPPPQCRWSHRCHHKQVCHPWLDISSNGFDVVVDEPERRGCAQDDCCCWPGQSASTIAVHPLSMQETQLRRERERAKPGG